MPKFFVNNKDINNNKISVNNEDSKHIAKVLRHVVGDKLTVGDGLGMDYNCEIESIEKNSVILKILEQKPNESEPKTKVTIFQGLPKQNKMELIIQKSVEIGVNKIVPIESEFSIAKTNDKTDKKVDRWQKISESAAKQSYRGIIPTVENPIKFNKMIDSLKNFDLVIIAYEKENCKTIKDIKNLSYNNIGIIIGPEGGFSQKEVEEVEKEGGVSVSLGKRILRSETAGFVTLALILHEFE